MGLTCVSAAGVDMVIQGEIHIEGGTLCVRTSIPDVRDWVRGDGDQTLSRRMVVTDETLYASTYTLQDGVGDRNYYKITANSPRAGAQHELGVSNARDINADSFVSSGVRTLETDFMLEGVGNVREVIIRDADGHPMDTSRLYASDKFSIRTIMTVTRHSDSDDDNWLPCV